LEAPLANVYQQECGWKTNQDEARRKLLENSATTAASH
jgi:hypothetical protein